MAVQASLERLRRGLAARVETDGRHTTAVPGLWLFRSSRPAPPKAVGAKMVTFAVILQGRKHIEFDDRRLSYGPGSFLFVTRERRYVATVDDCTPERPYLSMSLELPPEVVASALLSLVDAGARFEDDETDDDVVVDRLTPDMVEALLRMVATIDDPVGRQVLAPLAQRELVLHLLRHPAGAPLRRAAAGDDGRIRRATVYLQRHAEKRVTVEQVARHVAMSPSHFAHRFREVVRMSPMQYVKHLRLQRARVLMLGEGLGVAEAGATVGYASASHFTRDFKQQFGAAPGVYNKRFRA